MLCLESGPPCRMLYKYDTISIAIEIAEREQFSNPEEVRNWYDTHGIFCAHSLFEPFVGTKSDRSST